PPGVVDEDVEAALFLLHAGEQRFDLGVRRVVAADGHPLPTPLRDRGRRLPDRAGKTFGGVARVTAARDVDGRARLPEGEGDALADAATGPSNDRHPSAQQGHDTLPRPKGLSRPGVCSVPPARTFPRGRTVPEPESDCIAAMPETRGDPVQMPLTWPL